MKSFITGKFHDSLFVAQVSGGDYCCISQYSGGNSTCMSNSGVPFSSIGSLAYHDSLNDALKAIGKHRSSEAAKLEDRAIISGSRYLTY